MGESMDEKLFRLFGSIHFTMRCLDSAFRQLEHWPGRKSWGTGSVTGAVIVTSVIWTLSILLLLYSCEYYATFKGKRFKFALVNVSSRDDLDPQLPIFSVKGKQEEEEEQVIGFQGPCPVPVFPSGTNSQNLNQSHV